MAELSSVMATAAFSPRMFHSDPHHQGLGRGSFNCKDFQPVLPGQSLNVEVLKSGSVLPRSNQWGDPQNSSSLSLECNLFAAFPSHVNRPALIDVQDDHPDSVLFSHGIVEQCQRREKVLQFLASGSSLSNEGLDASLLNDLTGLHTLTVDMHPQPYVPMNDEFCLCDTENNLNPSIIYPLGDVHSPKPLVDFVGDMSHDAMMTVHPDGRVLFRGTETEMKNLLSIVANFYMSKKATIENRRLQTVVPYFRRSKSKASSISQRTLKLPREIATPLKSPEKINLNPSPKKKQNKKAASERDIYRNNYSHVCESFLSVVVIKNPDKTAFFSLKKYGHELSQLLTQFSAGIAGTGLAVLFSVIWKLSSGKAPLCTTKVLNTGFALGLVWLSLAVNTLRDTIVETTKNFSNLKSREDEIVFKVDKSVKEVFFRAAAVMAIVFLRFA